MLTSLSSITSSLLPTPAVSATLFQWKTPSTSAKGSPIWSTAGQSWSKTASSPCPRGCPFWRNRIPSSGSSWKSAWSAVVASESCVPSWKCRKSEKWPESAASQTPNSKTWLWNSFTILGNFHGWVSFIINYIRYIAKKTLHLAREHSWVVLNVLK